MKFINTSDRPKLYILMGIPGSGKSTWARRYYGHIPIVSSDKIREEKWPGEPYDGSRNEEVFDQFHKSIQYNLENARICVADATNCNPLARDKLSKIGRFLNAEIHLIVFDNIGQAHWRNAQRRGNKHGDFGVSEEVMKGMIDKYVGSLQYIDEEGYDSITMICDVK